MDGRLEVVIAGAGVAGLEAAFALKALAAERATVTVVSSRSEFLYRPQAVTEPFTEMPARRYPLAEVLGAAGARFVSAAFAWLDAPNRVVHTRDGGELRYGALLLALGARRRQRLRHAMTIDDTRLHDQVRELCTEVENGRTRSVVGVIPSRSGWMLPMYALALHLVGESRSRGLELSFTLATAEDAPLEIFGASASRAVAERLSAASIELITSVRCEVPDAGTVSLRPGMATLEADRVLALPQFFGPSTPGVPKRARGGFIAVDAHCRVRGVPGLYAAGDVTDFPVKLGAVAGEQADAAVAHIAASAGADIDAANFTPTIYGALRDGGEPLYMCAELIGAEAHRSDIGSAPPAGLPASLGARYLAAYLDAGASTQVSASGT